MSGKEEYRWKANGKKISGGIKFACEIDGGGGIYRGYEGKVSFIDGLRHGKCTLMDCDSQLNYIINYNKGLIEGYYRVYYEYYKPIKKKDGSMSNIKCDTTFYETTFVDGNGIWIMEN